MEKYKQSLAKCFDLQKQMSLIYVSWVSVISIWAKIFLALLLIPVYIQIRLYLVHLFLSINN